jgi:hypothetical protein
MTAMAAAGNIGGAMDGVAKREYFMDGSLARGFVRTEARAIVSGFPKFAGMPASLSDAVLPRFRKRDRLSPCELESLAEDLSARATEAFNPLYSSVTHRHGSKGRPNAATFEIVQYLVKPVDQAPIGGRTPKDRTMRLVVFTAKLNRRAVEMSLSETPACFYEHAARQYLVRGGIGHDAAIRTIGLRLAQTLILPKLTLASEGAASKGTSLWIPLAGGLLLGGFEDRQALGAMDGARMLINSRGKFNQRAVPPLTADYVARTYVNPEKLGADQKRIARQVDRWVEAHRDVADFLMEHHFLTDMKMLDDFICRREWDALVTEFRGLRNRLFGPAQDYPATAQLMSPWTGKRRSTASDCAAGAAPGPEANALLYRAVESRRAARDKAPVRQRRDRVSASDGRRR